MDHCWELSGLLLQLFWGYKNKLKLRGNTNVSGKPQDESKNRTRPAWASVLLLRHSGSCPGLWLQEFTAFLPGFFLSNRVTQTFLLWPHRLWGDIIPDHALQADHAPASSRWHSEPALFIVSVCCLLVLSAATLRQKPAKPANSLRRTKCKALSNSLPLSVPLPPTLKGSLIFPF